MVLAKNRGEGVSKEAAEAVHKESLRRLPTRSAVIGMNEAIALEGSVLVEYRGQTYCATGVEPEGAYQMHPPVRVDLVSADTRQPSRYGC